MALPLPRLIMRKRLPISDLTIGNIPDSCNVLKSHDCLCQRPSIREWGQLIGRVYALWIQPETKTTGKYASIYQTRVAIWMRSHLLIRYVHFQRKLLLTGATSFCIKNGNLFWMVVYSYFHFILICSEYVLRHLLPSSNSSSTADWRAYFISGSLFALEDGKSVLLPYGWARAQYRSEQGSQNPDGFTFKSLTWLQAELFARFVEAHKRGHNIYGDIPLA